MGGGRGAHIGLRILVRAHREQRLDHLEVAPVCRKVKRSASVLRTQTGNMWVREDQKHNEG